MHIPKCAGTTVHHYLSKYDDRSGFYKGPPRIHPKLGLFHTGHPPIFTFRDYFGSDFEKLQEYWAFTLMRDPFSRFASAISQRLTEFVGAPIKYCDVRTVKRELDSVIEYLSSSPRDEYLLPAEYIHFQKQIDYIALGGRVMIDKIYTVENIAVMFDDLGGKLGEDFCVSPNRKENRSMVFRNGVMRHTFNIVSPLIELVKPIVSKGIKEAVKSAIYMPSNRTYGDLFDSNYVREFVCDYYAEDIRLIDSVSCYKEASENSPETVRS